MTEQVYCFGPDEALVGVLTEPTAERCRTDAPVLLWLNSGVLHSVGPFGWYVTLARRFADQGITSFRFDISGVGDSPPRTDGRGKLETGVADATAAMEFLARERGTSRFVLVGVCSGAILAQQLAVHDDRVAGAVLIDGWGYRTAGFYLRYYAGRIFHWRTWVNAIGRLFRPRVAGGTEEDPSLEDRRLMIREFYFEFPDKELGREQLADARRRGAHLLFVYTGGVQRYFNHRRQFEEMIGQRASHDKLEVEYIPAADHMFSSREPRLALFNRIENWFQRLPESVGQCEIEHPASSEQHA